MRRLCTSGLILVLCVSPLAADGPLSRAVTREASQLAAEAVAPQLAGWEAVRMLDLGTPIVITTGAAIVTGRFVNADASSIHVRNGDAPEDVQAEDVLLVGRRVRRGSALAAVFGTLGGIWLGSAVAFGLAENARCYQGCADIRLGIWSAFVGVPIAAGYGSWRGSSHLTEEVVYRRPPAVQPRPAGRPAESTRAFLCVSVAVKYVIVVARCRTKSALNSGSARRSCAMMSPQKRWGETS